MKIIQSFWSKPSLHNLSSRANGGWLDKKHFYMSWALSCLQLRSMYDKVELITDATGHKLFIDILDLPYTDSVQALDDLTKYHDDLWVVGKLRAYGLQQEPFLHVDGDFFAFKKFNSRIENARLVAQNTLTIDRAELQILLQQISSHFEYIPEYMKISPGQRIMNVYNPGIFGGTDVPFLNTYSLECFKFIDDNIELINKNIEFSERDSTSNFGMNPLDLSNSIVESYLLTSLVNKYDYTVECLLDSSHLSTYEYSHILDVSQPYTHPLYYHKKHPIVAAELEYKLKKEFPHHYYKILMLVENFYI